MTEPTALPGDVTPPLENATPLPAQVMGPPEDFTTLPDLAARSLGGTVVAANDEFFAARDHLILDEEPGHASATFGAKGQVYDGWETRRRREPGHDHAIIRLGAAGVLRAVVVDTSFFTGNYPPYASVEACAMAGYPDPARLARAVWRTLVPRSPIRGDSRNVFPVRDPHRYTHLRLSIYPDGGVARLRAHGLVVPDPAHFPDGVLDLAAAEHGGLVVGCSNGFYGTPSRLIAPGLAATMGHGWETARRRDGGNDWVVVRLAAPGRIRLVELDTTHFKGNAPAAARLRGLVADPSAGLDAGAPGGLAAADPVDSAAAWVEILPRTLLQPDTRHRFPLDSHGGAGAARTVSQVRLDIFPDGGMARLRLPGRLAPDVLAALGRRWRDLSPPEEAAERAAAP